MTAPWYSWLLLLTIPFVIAVELLRASAKALLKIDLEKAAAFRWLYILPGSVMLLSPIYLLALMVRDRDNVSWYYWSQLALLLMIPFVFVTALLRIAAKTLKIDPDKSAVFRWLYTLALLALFVMSTPYLLALLAGSLVCGLLGSPNCPP